MTEKIEKFKELRYLWYQLSYQIFNKQWKNVNITSQQIKVAESRHFLLSLLAALISL